MWYQAQRRLSQACRADAGRKPKGGDPRSRPRLIHGLFVCPIHDQILYVGGSHGQSLFCKACRQLPADQRPLYSLLPRRLALTLTCRTLADLLRQDSQLVAAVIDACRRERPTTSSDPTRNRLQGLSSLIEALGRQIGSSWTIPATPRPIARNLPTNSGSSGVGAPGLDAEIKTLEAAGTRPAVVPTEAEVRELLARFEAILTSARIGRGDRQGTQVRQIIDLLTGGRIELFQCGEPKAQRGWLQGRFRLHLLTGLVQTLAGAAPPEDPGGVGHHDRLPRADPQRSLGRPRQGALRPGDADQSHR